MTTNSFIFRVDDPRIAILLDPGLDFLLDRFLGSICAIVRPKPRSFLIFWMVNINFHLRQYAEFRWQAADQKLKARVADSPGLKAALAWHFQHSVIKCWCSQDIRSKCVDGAGSDAWFAIIYFYIDDGNAGLSASGYSSD